MIIFRKTPTFALTLTAAACLFSACSSSSSSSPSGDDAGSSGGSSSSGSSGSSGGTCAGDGGKVLTNVTFDSSGKPTCASGVGCDLTTNVCCISSTGGTCNPKAMGEGGTGTGDGGSAEGCLPGQGSFGCIDDSSCPSGQVCCFQADQTAQTAGSSCQTVAPGGKCSPDITATAGSVQLCQTNSECVSGCCAWQDCTIMGRTLSLTMCGAPPTSSSVISCSPH